MLQIFCLGDALTSAPTSPLPVGSGPEDEMFEWIWLWPFLGYGCLELTGPQCIGMSHS